MEEDSYLAYMPIGYNDWMICYTVPVRSAQQAYDFISRYELIFMGGFCIMVAVLIVYIIFRNNREKAELLRTAQRDALTGVYNKENTQKVIDSILREKTPSAFHGFLIMDMDHFKEVNDVYGHAVGDKVLQVFGDFLKDQFREQDVIGAHKNGIKCIGVRWGYAEENELEESRADWIVSTIEELERILLA